MLSDNKLFIIFKDTSKASQSDLNDVLDAYDIDFTRINELENDESKEKAKNEFLSIFGEVCEKIDWSKIEPIKQDQETSKDYTRCIEQIRAMGILKDTSYIIKNVNDENNEPSYTLELPLWRGNFTGKTDAIIVENTGTNQCVIVMIEFKTHATICDGHNQGIMEYIGIYYNNLKIYVFFIL